MLNQELGVEPYPVLSTNIYPLIPESLLSKFDRPEKEHKPFLILRNIHL